MNYAIFKEKILIYQFKYSFSTHLSLRSKIINYW